MLAVTSILERESEAIALAKQLSLPYTHEKSGFNYFLAFDQERLSLVDNTQHFLPLSVDFLSKQLTYRRKHTHLRRELLARALGLKNKNQTTIIDATAGLAKDSFILASLGFEMKLIERSAVIHALLKDGIERASKKPDIQTIVSRMSLVHADSIAWLKQAKTANIIYLDPMFPVKTKSALSKKEMQIFKNMVGQDEDADHLLEIALACATQRVVVKRPRLAPVLAGYQPSYSLTGSSNRFDVYLTS